MNPLLNISAFKRSRARSLYSVDITKIGVAGTGTEILLANEVEVAIGKALGICEGVRGGFSAAGEDADGGAPVEDAEAAEIDEDAISAVRMYPEARPTAGGCVEEVV